MHLTVLPSYPSLSLKFLIVAQTTVQPVCLKYANTTDTEVIHILEVCHYWLDKEICKTKPPSATLVHCICPAHDTTLVSRAQHEWRVQASTDRGSVGYFPFAEGLEKNRQDKEKMHFSLKQKEGLHYPLPLTDQQLLRGEETPRKVLFYHF